MYVWLSILILFSSLYLTAIQRPPEANCVSSVTQNQTQRQVWSRIFAEKDVDGDVDRYLEESGAEADYRRFQVAPGQTERGEARLVIAVSPQSWATYMKYFGGRNVVEQIAPPNNQAYNRLRWQQEIFLGSSRATVQPAGTFGLPILLSDAEADRLHKALYIYTAYNRYVYPFQIPGYNFPNIRHYQNCAAWPGYLPIGDDTVAEIHGPGNLDQNASAAPIVGRLTSYNVPAEVAANDRALFQEVFSVPIHQPMWEMLGFPLREGDYSASGWSTHTLLGRASTFRLPIVVYYTNDHTQPIPDPINPQINLLGHPQPTSGSDGLHR